MRNEKGVISLFVLFAMLFLLVFSFSVYIAIRNNFSHQEYKDLEIQEIYAKDSIETIEYANVNELIPIYNCNQLAVAGTGSYLKINNKIYECGLARSYVLKNNIIIDIDEDLQYKKVGFCDYKLHAQSNYINENSYDLYYYKDNTYWKCIAYQRFLNNDMNNLKDNTFTQNNFSYLNNCPIKHNTFLMIWNDEFGVLSNSELDTQMITGKVSSVNQIDIYNKVIKNVDKEKGEYYLFVNIGNNI